VVHAAAQLNAARYALDQPLADGRSGSRVIPTFSVEAGLVFERDSHAGSAARVRQTLEPRAAVREHAVPRPERGLPNFDAAQRTSTSTRSTPRTPSPASTACPTRTRSPPA
jgi:lipopolysaccharide assembly outer membrane protein LptD (OstA)